MSGKVKLVRVDNRLLHATVALNWSRFVNASQIIIVDEKSKGDLFFEQVLQLSLPSTINVKILSADQLLAFHQELEKDTDGRKVNIILLFKKISDVYSAYQNGYPLREVQVPYPASRFLIKKLAYYYGDKDLQKIRELQKNGIRFYYQTTPMDVKEYSIFEQIRI